MAIVWWDPQEWVLTHDTSKKQAEGVGKASIYALASTIQNTPNLKAWEGEVLVFPRLMAQLAGSSPQEIQNAAQGFCQDPCADYSTIFFTNKHQGEEQKPFK